MFKFLMIDKEKNSAEIEISDKMIDKIDKITTHKNYKELYQEVKNFIETKEEKGKEGNNE